MTANDIANMVEKEPYHTNLNRITIANFIRQQHAEIAQLKVAYEQEQYRSKQWQERFESGRLT